MIELNWFNVVIATTGTFTISIILEKAEMEKGLGVVAYAYF